MIFIRKLKKLTGGDFNFRQLKLVEIKKAHPIKSDELLIF